jgi:hypothetical protein
MLCSACVWRVDQCRKYCAKTDTSTYDSYPYEPGTYLYGTGTGTVHDLRLLILVLTTANYIRNQSQLVEVCHFCCCCCIFAQDTVYSVNAFGVSSETETRFTVIGRTTVAITRVATKAKEPCRGRSAIGLTGLVDKSQQGRKRPSFQVLWIHWPPRLPMVRSLHLCKEIMDMNHWPI